MSRKMHSLRSITWTQTIALIVAIGVGVLMVSLPAFSQGQGTWLDTILTVHGVKDVPGTVQITGMVDRNGKLEPFRMLATREEQFRIDYGTAGKDAMVMGKKRVFRDDGGKITFNADPPGFAQLDATSLFFIDQLRTRPVRVVTTGDSAVIAGAKAQRIRVENDRSEGHKGAVQVKDVVDLYLTDGNLLWAISRSFYEGRPEAYTQTFVFSDYRKTENGLLPFQIDVFIKNIRRLTFRVEQYQFGMPTDNRQFVGARVK